MPSNFVGKSNGDLFSYLSMEQNQIPIGIYRGVWDKLGQGPGGNLRPYVYTCPAASSRIEKCDSIFVLSITHPETLSTDRPVKKTRRGKSALPSKSMVYNLHESNPDHGADHGADSDTSLNDVMSLLQKMNSKMERMDSKIKEMDNELQNQSRT